MKRFIAILIGLCLIFVMCVGCGAETDTNTETPSATDAADETEVLNILSLTSSTVDAYVESIDGNTLMLTLGTVSESSGMGGMTPPDMPSGDSGSTPPDMLSGDSGSTPPDMPSGGSTFIKGDTAATLIILDESVIYSEQNGKAQSAALSGIKEGSVIEIVIDENSELSSITVLDVTIEDAEHGSDTQGAGLGAPSGMGEAPSGGQSSGVSNYTAVSTYSEDATVEDESFSSTGADENAVLVTNSATVLFRNIALSRLSGDSTGGDSSSFYGVGAGLLVIDGTAYIDGGSFTTDAAGGAGVFAFDTGVVYIAGATISTERDTSGGIHVAGGGTLYAWDLTVTTQGNSSAAIRSDRGGGTMVIDGGSYTSNGTGSPAVYCTADIAVNDAVLTATGSEAVCVEGLNSLYLFDTELSGDMNDDSQDDTTWTVIVYQSMSGDSEVGNSTFNMVGGKLVSLNGGLLYTTNTECHILLSDVEIEQSEDCEFFLQCTGNNNQRGWGSAGSNGSDCTFTAVSQSMTGDVIWDSVSTLSFYMTEGSALYGAVVNDETWAGNGGNGYCKLYIDESSSWIVTGNSSVTELYSAGVIEDAEGNSVGIIGTDGVVYVQGTSEYTITVSTYETTADMSGADSVPTFSAYAVEKPSELE